METIKALANLSERLDKSGLESYADQIDKTAKSINKIVKAQFEGGLGYAIRNSRCWEKCYRENRVKKPGTSAQDIVLSCWEEYNKSINDNDSSWDKYADIDTPIVKTANKELSDKIVDLVKSGATVTEAFSTIDANERYKLTTALIEKADDLLKISAKLVKMDKKASNELLIISHNLIKEAGFWGGLMGKNEFYKQSLNIFKEDANLIKQRLQEVISNPQEALKQTRNIGNLFQSIVNNLNKLQQWSGLGSRAIRPFVTQAEKSLLTFRNAFLTVKEANQAVQIATQATAALDALLQQEGLVEQKAEEETQQQTEQQPGQQGQQQDIMEVIQSADESKLSEIVNNIMSNPDGLAAARQWFISTLQPARSASYNLKNYKMSQVGAVQQDPQQTPQQTLPEISPQMVPQIMAAVANKFGPKFNQWFSTAFESVLGLQPAAAQPAPQAEEQMGMDQAIQLLDAFANKALKMSNSLPDNLKKSFMSKVNAIRKVHQMVQSIEGVMAQIEAAQAKVQSKKPMMGYYDQQGAAGEAVPGSGIIGTPQ